MFELKTTLALGNTKLGRIRNVSLNHDTCRPDAPCRATCYNNKAWRLYREVREAYNHNTDLYDFHPGAYFDSIQEQLETVKTPGHFRWHVSGDIPDTSYLTRMITLAERLPKWSFMAFTKRYELINNLSQPLPKNLHIVFSAWEHFPLPNPHNYPVAYHDNPSDPDERIPDNAIPCTKQCDECFQCWGLKKGQSVRLIHH